MSTVDLIALLARGAGPVPRHLALRRIVPAAGLGLLAAAVGSAVALGLIAPAIWGPAGLAVKLAYAGGSGALLLKLLARLGRPGVPLSTVWWWGLVPLAAMLAWGLVDVAAADPGTRAVRVLGGSALRCPLAILVLALPGLAALLLALRGMAPVHLRRTGLAAGLAAGCIGAIGYALACDEGAPAFIATWYTLGILLSGGLGLALGPRALRW